MAKSYIFKPERAVNIPTSVGVFVVVTDQEGLHEVLLLLRIVHLHYLLDDWLHAADELVKADDVWVLENWHKFSVGHRCLVSGHVDDHLVSETRDWGQDKVERMLDWGHLDDAEHNAVPEHHEGWDR